MRLAVANHGLEPELSHLSPRSEPKASGEIQNFGERRESEMEARAGIEPA